MKSLPLVQKYLSTLLMLIFLALGTNANAAEINDSVALSGIKEGKGVYLISLDNPQKTALYLEIIKSTHQSMAAQGVKPDFILVFVGATVRFLTTEPAEEAKEIKPVLQSIASSVKALKELGVRQEVCVIATNFFKVPNEKLLPGLSLVGNGFTSLIGYQAKGYGLVPIF
ncbi:DsrE family protein [Halodesulfovibrio marinisediminis]|uniref:DsrE/DsrF-like family protein n=1 Tax=Halodesulfovibrio marinisediminis DSM 17456 TaxID=1121457 RepID=A0A1N6DXD3_9BACT|nr:DsrE family protein [Halodesulfovibrio marinisediminis]SIN75448.1 DsrE/DsrF-like family protein [Halodesulfovibrio marinisediminis DSM 17456]